MVPKKQSLNSSIEVIKNIIFLKHTIELLPSLIEVLESSQNVLIKVIHFLLSNFKYLQATVQNLKSPHFNEIKTEIEKMIREDVKYAKSTYQMRMEQCFAVFQNLI